MHYLSTQYNKNIFYHRYNEPVKAVLNCFGRKALESDIILGKCQSMKRMINALSYYQSIKENITDQATQNIAFAVYFNEEYMEFLDDYNHIISTHSEHLETIYAHLDPCNLSKCKLVPRYINRDDDTHNGDYKSNTDDENDGDGKLKLYMQLVANIHFWFYHQFDVGMRVKRNTLDDIKNDDICHQKHFDREFARIKKEVIARRNTLDVRSNNSNKYTIQTDNNISKMEHKDEPFTDTFFKSLRSTNIAHHIVKSISEFIKREDFDTDAIISDIIDYKNGSNIKKQANDAQASEFIEEYADEMNGKNFPYLVLLIR